MEHVPSGNLPKTCYKLGLWTPFMLWPCYSDSVVALPGNEVVANLGPQIVLLDMETRRVAFLTRGRSPIVTLDGPAARRR